MRNVPTPDFKTATDAGAERLRERPEPLPPILVGLLTGGYDRPYVYGLAMALAARGVRLEIIGSDMVYRPELDARPELHFLNLRGDQKPNVGRRQKLLRVFVYYLRLIRYAWSAKPKVFHILWDNKFLIFDRTVLMLYYKLLGKKIAFTAMNVNAGIRDANDSAPNRLSLKIQYRLADHLFVHTEKMSRDLIRDFGLCKNSVTIVPMGVNNSVSNTDLTPAEAKAKLAIGSGEKAILFFGTIRPYKGLQYLVTAFQMIASEDNDYRLLIVGDPMTCGQYWREVEAKINADPSRERIIRRIEFIADNETELYFKAADVSVLPYTEIFQSGVLVLSYGFGLPVIATDVGSLREDIVDGKTGFICGPRDPHDLARAIKTYFKSDLYAHLDERREQIRDYANRRNSWDVAAEATREVYVKLLGKES